MKFLRDYSYDVFVSYAHGTGARGHYSGKRHDLLPEWTHRFVDDLIAQIDFNLSQVEGEGDEKARVKFFMDPDLEGSGSLTDNLREKAKASALLLVVMSPPYLRSSWCTDEIAWFSSATSEENPELRPFGRIFVARILPTDHTTWPNGLKDELGRSTYGHWFHSKTERDQQVVPYGWPSPDKTIKEYWLEIVRLAGEMTAKLRRLKELERRSAKAAVSSATESSAIEPAVGRQVLLGYMHDTLIPVRSELRRELTKLGLQVLPPENDDAWDEPSLRQLLDTYLDQAHVMALCANQYCGTWPRDQIGGFISLQAQKAKERNVPCQLWLSWDQSTEPQTPEYKRFLQDLNEQSKNSPLEIKLDHQSVSEFARYVKDTVNKEVVVPGGVEQLAVVCSNLRSKPEVYRRFYDTVMTAISETDRISILPSFENASGHIRLKDLESDINRADTIVVICFDQEWQWATNVMREIRQLLKADAAKRVRLLIIGPQAKAGVSIDTRAFRFTTLNAHAMDEEHLRELLKEAILGNKDGARQTPIEKVS
jgi:hypothetical protein